MLINRSRFLGALCYSPRQLSLCELSIVLAEAAPVRQSPAVIRLLCGGGISDWNGVMVGGEG